MQDAHIKDRGDLGEHFHRKRLDRQHELKAFYKIDDQTREIENLRADLAKKPSLWRRMSGGVKADREELERLEGGLANSQSRIDQYMRDIDSEYKDAAQNSRTATKWKNKAWPTCSEKETRVLPG